MEHNFEVLKDMVLNTNIIKGDFKKIKGPTLFIGNGGSDVVSEYAALVIGIKNNLITKNILLRDLNYMDVTKYKNIFVASYSCSDYNIKICSKNNLKKFFLTNKKVKGRNYIVYDNNMDKEKSFISLASSIMPMKILLDYYLGNSINIVKKIFKNIKKYNIKDNTTYEIMSGYDTHVASSYLESTFVEAGLGNIIIHDKYNYCHGRSTLSYNSNNTLIYLINNKTELDDLLLNECKNYYKEIIVIDSNYNDIVIDNFNLTLRCMYLTKEIAELKSIDLSNIKYCPIVKKLYHYNGEM